MPSNRAERQEEARFRVMRLIEGNPNLSTREIAADLGVSNGKAYYLLASLIEKGLVKANNFSSSNTKSNYLYILTPKGLREKASLTGAFLERKRQEYDDLRLEIESLSAELNSTEASG